MDDLTFQWNEVKNASNQKKHGVSFAEAQKVFSDEFARLILDPDHSENEDRFILLGASTSSRLLIVCHCLRENDVIRIISARKANRQEREIYERYRYAQRS